MPQAGAYGAALHHLQPVAAAGTTGARPVMERTLPINDMMTQAGSMREDGRAVRPMLLVDVKQPAELTGPFDTSRIEAEIPARDAVRPFLDGGWPLVAH